MNKIKKVIKPYIVFFIRTTLNLVQPSRWRSYLAKLEAYQIIYNPITKNNDRLHDISTYQGLGSNYRRVLNGFEFSSTGKFISKQSKKIWEFRYQKCFKEEHNESNFPLICFATRSWHFLTPLVKYCNENNVAHFCYDLNEFDKKVFENTGVVNKSKYHRDNAFLNFYSSFCLKSQKKKVQSDYIQESDRTSLGTSDVIFVDWLNHNTIWAINNIPVDKKIVVRVHSYEVLSFFPITINFGRIDGLIFISEGIKNMFIELWGWMLPEGIAVTVIDNIRDSERLYKVSRRDEKSKVLGMMQYSMPVKDFSFALSMFKELYLRDSSFKLVLCGKTLQESGDSLSLSLLEELQSFPKGVITELGYLDDVTVFFEQVGFVLSTSEREGSHESIVEGMKYGCIPIVRDWPLLAPFNGAKNAFPMCETISDELDGVKQILAYSQEFDLYSTKFQKESERFFDQHIAERYLDFIKKVCTNV